MDLRFSEFGSIEDIGYGQYWDPARISAEVASRTADLSSAGVTAGTTVMIAHSHRLRFFADLFAVWTLDCAAACIDPTSTADEIETLTRFISPSAVLVDGSTPSIPAGVSNTQPINGKLSTANRPEQIDTLRRPALILFTSGTTGNPKGVVLSFGALLSRVSLNRAAMGKASQLKTLVTLPTSFGHGLIGNALTPLLSGGDIVLHPVGLPLAKNLGEIVDQHGIGFLSSVPSFWRMALKFSNSPSENTLKRIHVGSAPLSASLWSDIAKWSRAEVVNCYGITELANWVAGASSQTEGIADGLVGRPWGGKVAVRSNEAGTQNEGDGELLVKSPSAMSGYLHRPDLTSVVFADGWYRTGDTAHLDKHGLVTLTGRIKDEINRAGFKVQPAEIDALLEAHPAVAEACVFGIPDYAGGEAVAAAVCITPGQTSDIESLRQWCATKIRREAIPERWFIVDKLPRNERGKVNRDAVRVKFVESSQ